MKKFLVILLMLILLLPVTAQALAQDSAGTCNFVSMMDGWVRDTVEGQGTSAGYGFLVNFSAQDDRLIAVSSDAAASVEIHQTSIGEGDVMQMAPVEGGLVVPAGSFVELAPGGYHLMFIEPTAPFEADTHLDVVLTFENAGDVPIVIPVKAIEDSMGHMDHMGGMPGHDMAMGGMPGHDMAATEEAATGEHDHDMAATEEAAMGEHDYDHMTGWPEACSGMWVLDPWVRAAGTGTPNSAGYALLVNLTEMDDTLLSAAADISQVVELHEMRMAEGDVMQMSPVEGGIAVKAGGVTLLRPGGLHVMFIGLTGELPVDATVDITLTFAQYGEIAITVPVREAILTNVRSTQGG